MRQFAWILVVFQILLTVLVGFFSEYSSETEDVSILYQLYRDVNVMVFLGFGFLMTFPKTYSWTAVGINFALSVLTIEWALLIRGFGVQIWKSTWTDIDLEVHLLIEASFSAAVVLITFGVLLGNVSPIQMIFIALFETVFAVLSELICYKSLGIADIGGSMVLHLFGGVFGLAASTTLGAPEQSFSAVSTRNRTLFGFLGTLFLWVYWPSFNSALAPVDSGSAWRAVVNTVIALCAGTVSTFFTSAFLSGRDHGHKLEMEHIQNSSLAAAVGVGAVANLAIGAWAAFLIGAIAGIISTIGFKLITPRLAVTDTCGVLNLHAVPGFIGGVASIFAAFVGYTSKYNGESITDLWPDRDGTRTASRQALYQLGGLLVTLCISISSGALCGVLTKALFSPVSIGFNDAEIWDMAHVSKEDEEERFNGDSEHSELLPKPDVELGAVGNAEPEPEFVGA
jgi:ammonium transporter Rh